MFKKSSLMLFILLIPMVIFAHLCNDVFVQAQDNLAVKVDIRDDQLRINKSASFRVYLLNTMDRDIVDIRLEIISDHFRSKVTASPEWNGYPYLKTKKRGGKKQYFEVKLTRKPGIKQGKYKIGLNLFNGKDKSMVFKTIDIAEAMSEMNLPTITNPIKIDGKVTKEEWSKSLLCASFYEYKKSGRYYYNCPTAAQSRIRFKHDDKNIYCLLDFRKPGTKDMATIMVAKDDHSPIQYIDVDLQKGIAMLQAKPMIPLTCAKKGARIELQIPKTLLNLESAKSCMVNVIRKQDAIKTYWRGNQLSEKDPVIFANFKFK